MQGYGLTYVLYEVLDLNEKIENDIDLSGLEVMRRDFGLEVTKGDFQPEQKMQKQELNAQDIETCLKEIVSHSKKQNSKDKVQESFLKDKKTKSKIGETGAVASHGAYSYGKTSQRIPHGFSFKRGSKQSRMGPAPTCHGCKNPITSSESKLIHKHK